MNKINPSDIDLYIKYECTDCGLPHWLQKPQLVDKDYFIICDCGFKFKPNPPSIGKIKNYLVYTNEQDETAKSSLNSKKSASNIDNKSEIQSATNGLKAIGFSEQEIIAAIKKLDQNKISSMTYTEIYEQLLRII